MPRVQGLLLSARKPCVSTHAHGCKVHRLYVTAVDGPRRVGSYSARASMQKERSKWRIVTGEEEPEWSSKRYVGPSVTQQQEAELLRRNVKAARYLPQLVLQACLLQLVCSMHQACRW